jgi:hypothetical protein
VRFAKPKDLPFYEHVWPNLQNEFTGKFDILRASLKEQMKAAVVQVYFERSEPAIRPTWIHSREGRYFQRR